MTFHDIRIPNYDEPGSAGGPGNSTSVITMDSGQERRIVRWSEFRHRYDVSWRVKSYSDLAEMKQFYLARGGLAHSFRYKDWLDYNTTALGKNWEGDSNPPTDTDQIIGTGDDSTTTFQLVKRYEDAEGSYVRPLTKIVEDSVVVAIDGTPTASGWTVNLTTGVITFSVAPAMGEVVTAGCEFDVEVRFGDGADEFFATVIDGFGSGQLPVLPLIEVLPGSVHNEDVNYGGAKPTETINTDTTIDMTALFWSYVMQNTNLILPAISSIPKGGPIFVVEVDATSTGTNKIKDSGGNDIAVPTAGTTTRLYHVLNASGASRWLAIEDA